MTVVKDFKQLSNTELGKFSSLTVFAQQALNVAQGDHVRAGRQIWDAAKRREDWGLQLSQFFTRELAKDMIFEDRSGNTLKRDEEQGHCEVAREGQTMSAPSSPAKPYVHPSLERHTENGNGGAGHHQRANQGQSLCARPAAATNAERVRTDGKWGQAISANNGHRRVAPSPSAVSNVSRFKPGNARRGAVEIASVQTTMARSLLDTYKVRDGRAIGDITLKDVSELEAQNREEAYVLRKIAEHTANGASHQTVREILTDKSLERFISEAKEMANAA